MKSLKGRSSKTEGLSLIELVIGIGIFGVMLVAIMSAVDIGVKGNKSIQLTVDADNLFNSAKLALSQSNLCTCNLLRNSQNSFRGTTPSELEDVSIRIRSLR